MLRLVQVGNALPASFICDPSAEFQPGQIAQLIVLGNQVMATVSNGTAPIGILIAPPQLSLTCETKKLFIKSKERNNTEKKFFFMII